LEKKKGQFNQDDLIMDTDQVVLILSYIIIQCQVPHLFSEFNFIDDFIDVFSERDEPGYCVTILHTALLYIRDTLEIPTPPANTPLNTSQNSTTPLITTTTSSNNLPTIINHTNGLHH